MSAKRPRREFLKQLPVTMAAGLAVPTLVDGQPSGGPITAEDLDAAQRVSGLALPADERLQAQVLVNRNRDAIEAIRAVPLRPEVEPAFSFRPPRPAVATPAAPSAPSAPGTSAPGTSAPRHFGTPAPPAALVRPARLEDLAFAPVTTLSSLLHGRQITSVELTRMYLDRLTRHDARLHTVVTRTDALALAQATEADRELASGRSRGPLHGVPYGIKDLFATAGIPTTWGAQPYADQVFDYDATTVVKLREAGAVLVAKLSTGELAIGDLWFRARTRNPWDPERGANGSSAGPAAATAAGLVGFAVGTETGGSIVSPAATCGVVGLRPTYGRSSRYGCMTLRWTLDKVGPLTRSVQDAALVLDAIHGPDGKDETVPPGVPFDWDRGGDVGGLRIGYIDRELGTLPDAATAEEREQFFARKPLYDAALQIYRDRGATLVPVTLPDLPAAAVYALLNAEAGAMFDELLREGRINQLADKSPNGRANQLRATRFIPAVDYIRAQRVRTLLVQQTNALFDNVDVFLSPSASASMSLTNLTGHPAAVVPAGFVDGLPIALMITGRLWDEATVCRVAQAFESATDWHTRHPAL
ncbi:MAG: amidase [Vicinamibacterales bacterium]|nr:amidase [Vicinamibacterales bacterium]